MSVAVTEKHVPSPPLVSTQLARIDTTHLTYDDPYATDREHCWSVFRSRIERHTRSRVIRLLLTLPDPPHEGYGAVRGVQRDAEHELDELATEDERLAAQVREAITDRLEASFE